MTAIAIGTVLAGLCALVLTLWKAPRELLLPLAIYNLFYVVTSAIGATVIVFPEVRAAWMLFLPSMNASWLAPGESARYWVLLWGPLVVVNAVALTSLPWLRRPAVVTALWLRVRPDLLSCWMVGLGLVGYCLINLALKGFLGVTLFSVNSEGAYVYRENVLLRTEMAPVLGELHYAFIYMTIPAVCIVALQRAVTLRSAGWWWLFGCLSAMLAFLYSTTLTKGNLIVFGIAVVAAARFLRLIGGRGLLLAMAGGLCVLVVQELLLSGTGVLGFGVTIANVIFRLASGIPFYLEIFPAQVNFVGPDFGLAMLGIEPAAYPNLIVGNIMFPKDTWVQSFVPAPDHIMAYAQWGIPWSLLTMAATGVMAAAAGALGRVAHSPLSFSAFIGACIACYNFTQADFIGAFNLSYGYKWWFVGVMLIGGVQRILSLATHGAVATPVPSTSSI